MGEISVVKMKEIFTVFSKRKKIEKPIDISIEVRNRVIMLLINLSDDDGYGWNRNNFKYFSWKKF